MKNITLAVLLIISSFALSVHAERIVRGLPLWNCSQIRTVQFDSSPKHLKITFSSSRLLKIDDHQTFKAITGYEPKDLYGFLVEGSAILERCRYSNLDDSVFSCGFSDATSAKIQFLDVKGEPFTSFKSSNAFSFFISHDLDTVNVQLRASDSTSGKTFIVRPYFNLYFSFDRNESDCKGIL